MNKRLAQTDFSGRLLAWFDEFGRHDLPWQQQPTPYRVWVSEVMLQQTQVKTVIPYFERFSASFPTVEALAGASIDQVLHHWSGLGYYARGRNLHLAAQTIMREHNGEMPADIEVLMSLPGIGRSTAGAILALAYRQRHPILDGNVKRVLARSACIDGAPSATKVQNRLWELAEALTPHARVADYTQAIMDLGATVCRRRDPHCDRCPVADTCRAFERGEQHSYPTPKVKKSLPTRRTRCIIVQHREHEVMLEKRPPQGIWGGLWCFPDLDDNISVAQWCQAQGFDLVGDLNQLEIVKHTFTHFKLEIQPLALRVEKKPAMIMDESERLWYNVRHPQPVGLAKPTSAILKSLEG